MILSHKQLEEIAAAVTKDFNHFFFEKGTNRKLLIQATPIDRLAEDYLGLRVSFARLSPDATICGITAYANTEYLFEEMGVMRRIPLKKNQVLLDTSFMQPGLCGKRRFTLAHECAHQILFQLESDERKRFFERTYAARTAYSLRELKTREDWNEWQANVLGAAILMPQGEVERAMYRFSPGCILQNYGGMYNYHDRTVLTMFCRAFGVSRSAAVIRLRELGFLEDRPYLEYNNSEGGLA